MSRTRSTTLAVALLASLALLPACASTERVAETGRARPQLQYTEAQMNEMGAAAYPDAIKGYRVIRGTPEDAMLQEVGRKIAAVSGKNYRWEFKLLDAPDQQNAFCLPGGKVAVFSGILPIAQDEAGLAVILGHEVAHATLQHANERMSQPRLKRVIGRPLKLGADIWGALAPNTRRLAMGAFGLGHIVGEFMPYSQDHEFEADDVGLDYMVRAGYDAQAAPAFWRRMMAATPGQRKSDALSTHPDAGKRIDRLERKIGIQTNP